MPIAGSRTMSRQGDLVFLAGAAAPAGLVMRWIFPSAERIRARRLYFRIFASRPMIPAPCSREKNKGGIDGLLFRFVASIRSCRYNRE
jgi:hypothetical protein